MKNYTSIHTALATALLCLTLGACGDSGSNDTGENTSTGDNNTTMDPGTTTPDPTTTTDTTVTPTTIDDPTTETPTSTTVDPTTMGPDPTATTGDDPGFIFPTDPFDAYEQIDRHGAVEAGTAGIAAAQGLGFKPGSDITIRDAYNASNPAEDAGGMWIPEIGKSITFFHDALDDDIEGLGLVPATIDDTLMQAGPVIVPDTIKYDPTKPTAYPNGRKLEDPVVDITLAAVLLKLGPMQPLSLFADLPLNPPANDVPFLADFPYLAPPHAP
jgi:hypothetical protein